MHAPLSPKHGASNDLPEVPPRRAGGRLQPVHDHPGRRADYAVFLPGLRRYHNEEGEGMKTCKDCKFYCGGTRGGECRKHPPTVTTLEVRKCERDGNVYDCWKEVENYTEFPTVMSDYWCGEFAPIEPEQAPAFDAEKVRHLLGVLMYLTAKQGEEKGKENITAYMYNNRVIAAREKLLVALGIEE